MRLLNAAINELPTQPTLDNCGNLAIIGARLGEASAARRSAPDTGFGDIQALSRWLMVLC